MPTLRVLNGSGDQRITWSAPSLLSGDAEAQAAVREAERILERERGRGALAFRIHQGQPAERVDTLDPFADETVVVPPIVGG